MLIQQYIDRLEPAVVHNYSAKGFGNGLHGSTWQGTSCTKGALGDNIGKWYQLSGILVHTTRIKMVAFGSSHEAHLKFD